MMTRLTLFAAVTAVGVASAAVADGHGDTIERLGGDDKTLRLGYRTDAAPFASEVEGQPVGYTVDLCRAVGETVARAFPNEITVAFVPVTADTRFSALESGEIDVLCGATTVTLDRRETMDFSLMTFVTGGVLLVRKSEAVFGETPSTIGVLGGTTSESALNRILAVSGDAADVVIVENHADGLAKLRDGEVEAYFGDRALLVRMMAENPGSFTLSEDVVTFEPYALAMRRGDSALRLLADKALARLYRDGEINRIYKAAFGDARPGSGLVAIYNLMALSDDE